MCRGTTTCSELGTDPKYWGYHSPLQPPSWMSDEIDRFVTAANSLVAGSRSDCIRQIKQIRSAEITHWYIEHGQMSGKHRNAVLRIAPPPDIPKNERDPLRSPNSIQQVVFERDFYKCRYCGNRLIAQEVLRLVITLLHSPEFMRGGTNVTTHGIIHITWPVADHVVPWNKGGMTNVDNLVSSCAACNYGKDGYTIEQLGLENPFDRAPIDDGWAGLVDTIEDLRNISSSHTL